MVSATDRTAGIHGDESHADWGLDRACALHAEWRGRVSCGG